MPATMPQGREKLYETNEAAKPDHDAAGRFARGNRGGPGNPFARYVGELRQAMISAVRPADLQQMIRVLIEKALTGDLAAARLVLQYTLGKPTAAPDPDRADLDEAKLHLEGSTKPAEVEEFLRSMPPTFVNVMAEEVRPVRMQKNMAEAERLAEEEAANRVRLDAEMTAEEDAWEAAERNHPAPREVVASHADKSPAPERREFTSPPSANGHFREAAPSTNDILNLTRPLTSGELDQLLQCWTRENRPAG